MKYLFTVLWAVICVSILIWGHSYWNEKIAVHATTDNVNGEASLQVKDGETGNVDVDTLLAKAQNWPDSAKEQLKQAIENQKKFKILFVGTDEMDGWKDKLRSELVNAFGKNVVEVDDYKYGATTDDFVNNKNELEITSRKPQLVIFEPFLINDNYGIIPIENTLGNITKIIANVQKSNKETSFILQPSYPLYLAKTYLKQVDALKAYAQENHLGYIDHWTSWPKTTDQHLTEYLKSDQSGPSEKGNQVWEKAISHFLIIQ